ncbi:MAG: hypothetical protein ACI8P3_000620, partial [Saprospiraceae bacterium]
MSICLHIIYSNCNYKTQNDIGMAVEPIINRQNKAYLQN